MGISLWASQEFVINFVNNSQKIKIKSIQLVYETDGGFFCGHNDDGSNTRNREIVERFPSPQISVLKTRSNTFCNSKLSLIIVQVINPYGYVTDYISLPVKNSFNRNTWAGSKVATSFTYFCKHDENYGCNVSYPIADLKSEEITIIIEDY